MNDIEKTQFASSGVMQFKDKLLRDIYVDIKYHIVKYECTMYRKNKN